MLHMVMIESLDQLGLGPVNPLLQVPQFTEVSFERMCNLLFFWRGEFKGQKT